MEIDWSGYTPPKPKMMGLKAFHDVDYREIREYIDWTPYFQSWQLKGKYPAIFEDKVVGEEARKVFEDAQVMLDRIIREDWLRANAVIGFFPAQSEGDRVYIYEEDGKTVREELFFLRQQVKRAKGIPNISLADFIAPKSSGKMDYIGGFAVTAGLGIEPHVKKYVDEHDDYNSIVLKAMADRCAEALAEMMHHKNRTCYWGYQSNEDLTNEQLIHDDYQGIRPAPGYPACPDHTEKDKLFRLLNATENTEIILTESYAMYPAAAVSGWYFSHPDSRYFGVGKIDRDQVEDYARMKGMTVPEVERWLNSLLGY